MKTRWFGEPWPTADDRGPICEDDALRVEVPLGYRCLRCGTYFKEGDQGIVLPVLGRFEVESLWDPEIPDKWMEDVTFGLIADDTDGQDVIVAAEHLNCLLHDVLGVDVPGIPQGS